MPEGLTFVSDRIYAGKINYADIIVFVQVLLPQPLYSAQPAQMELVCESIESWYTGLVESIFVMTMYMYVYVCMLVE